MEKAAPRRVRRFRPAIAAAAALLAVLMAVPVMAASNPQVMEYLRHIYPRLAGSLFSVEESCTANDIRVEVMGISASDSKAQLLMCFRKADGTPLDVWPELENVYFDVYHSWNHSGTYGYTPADSEDKVLMLEMTCRNGTLEEFYGTKTTVLIDTIALPETTIYEVPLVLSDCAAITVPKDFSLGEAPLEHFWQFGIGSRNDDEHIRSQEEFILIDPVSEPVHALTEHVAVTGMCYIDGRLHIQICQSLPYEDLNFCAWLEDADGSRIYENAFHNYGLTEDGREIRGTEHYFDIPQDELSNYKLMVEVTEMNRTNGPWEVSFVLSENDHAAQ